METKTDVCIVGGGPAGLVLALLLVRSGIDVTVAEKSGSFDREYRGEILQPGAMRLLDQLGVLDDARSRGCIEHSRFQLVERDRVLLDVDYRRLAPPYDCLLSIPQRHILEALLNRCERYAGFRYLPRTRLSRLFKENEALHGAVCDGPDGPHTIRSECVVGADGRYSKTRGLAGIGFERSAAFDIDVLWFKLTDPGLAGRRDVRVYRDGGAPAMTYYSYPDQLQIGWTLPHGAYQAMAAEGPEHIKSLLVKALPRYREQIEAQVTGLQDLSLLDAFSGRADRWADTGLLLVGDSAHTHSPIGAQGINLAIQDAVLAHPLLVKAVRSGNCGAKMLSLFEQERAPDIALVFRLQAMQTKAMLSQGGLAARVRPTAARVVKHTPIYQKVLSRIAFGNPDIRISTDT